MFCNDANDTPVFDEAEAKHDKVILLSQNLSHFEVSVD